MISFSRAFDNGDIGWRSERLLQVLSVLIPCSTDKNKIQDSVFFSLFPVDLARVLVNVPGEQLVSLFPVSFDDCTE